MAEMLRSFATLTAALGMTLSLVRAQSSVHPVHPPMSNRPLYLHVRWGEGSNIRTGEFQVALPSVATVTTLDQTVEWEGGRAPLRLVRYLPYATLEQRVAPADGTGGQPLIELFIEGPTQSFQRWLVAGDPERNRLVSFIGTWRFMSISDRGQRNDLFQQFETEFTRAPRLHVSRPDGSGARLLPLPMNGPLTLEELGATVRVLHFYPDFGRDSQTQEAVNRSPKRRNPAALVEITGPARAEKRWIFAKFPHFEPKESELPPLRIQLDCPVEGPDEIPDFVLVTIGREEMQAWTRHLGKTASAAVRAREPVAIPGTQYRFEIWDFVPAGRLTEAYRPTEPGKGKAALLLEVVGAPEEMGPVWLALGESKTIAVKPDPITLTFSDRPLRDSGEHP
jgi:hypothetical protein